MSKKTVEIKIKNKKKNTLTFTFITVTLSYNSLICDITNAFFYV